MMGRVLKQMRGKLEGQVGGKLKLSQSWATVKRPDNRFILQPLS